MKIHGSFPHDNPEQHGGPIYDGQELHDGHVFEDVIDSSEDVVDHASIILNWLLICA